MKKIVGYIRNYFREEWHPLYFIFCILLTAGLVVAEYGFDLSEKYIDIHFETPQYFWAHLSLYGGIFWSTILAYVLVRKKYELLRDPMFLVSCIFIIAVYAFRCSYTGFRSTVSLWASRYDINFVYFWVKCSNQLMYGTMLFIPGILWYWFNDRREKHWYGFNKQNTQLKIYWLLLLIMVPLIAIASTQRDFLAMYPQYSRFIYISELDTFKEWLRVTFFELCYGYDFMMNEFFFRGLIVLALAKYLGKGAILPMVCFYVCIHFGKPLGETISSFFGGMILGVIAYETKSIYGGVIIHIGIAWLMEIGGTLGALFL